MAYFTTPKHPQDNIELPTNQSATVLTVSIPVNLLEQSEAISWRPSHWLFASGSLAATGLSFLEPVPSDKFVNHYSSVSMCEPPQHPRNHIATRSQQPQQPRNNHNNHAATTATTQPRNNHNNHATTQSHDHTATRPHSHTARGPSGIEPLFDLLD